MDSLRAFCRALHGADIGANEGQKRDLGKGWSDVWSPSPCKQSQQTRGNPFLVPKPILFCIFVTMNFQNPNFTPAMASARIRTLWQNFEQSQAKDRAQLDRSVQLALEKTEAAWNKTPTNSRMSRIKHNAAKVGIAKAIKTTYFEKARAQWHEKLESYGLKADYWTDLTEDEKMRITNTLGADDESDEEVVVILPESSPPPIPHPTTTHSSFLQPLAPSFSTSSRATNLSSSSYALVNPSEFNSDEDDFEFEIPLSNPVVSVPFLTNVLEFYPFSGYFCRPDL